MTFESGFQAEKRSDNSGDKRKDDVARFAIGIREDFASKLNKLSGLIDIAKSQKFGSGHPQPKDVELFRDKYGEDIVNILEYGDMSNKLEAYKMARDNKYGGGNPTLLDSKIFFEKYGLDLNDALQELNAIEDRFDVFQNIEKAEEHFDKKYSSQDN